MNIVNEKIAGCYRFRVIQDENTESPRSWDNLGIIMAWHNRYNLGDPDSKNFKPSDFAGWKELGEAIEKELDPVVMMPLYMMDHSGLTIRTRDFSDCGIYGYFDSGMIGWIIATRSEVKKAYGDNFMEDDGRIKQVLESEIETFNQYLNGEVYGYTLEENHYCEKCERDGWVDVDSCWGFYGGSDPVKNSMADNLDEEVRAILFPEVMNPEQHGRVKVNTYIRGLVSTLKETVKKAEKKGITWQLVDNGTMDTVIQLSQGEHSEEVSTNPDSDDLVRSIVEETGMDEKMVEKILGAPDNHLFNLLNDLRVYSAIEIALQITESEEWGKPQGGK